MTNKSLANTSKEAKPLNFYNDGRYAFVNIYPEIIMQLKLTPTDKFTQEVTDENHIVLTRRKETA